MPNTGAAGLPEPAASKPAKTNPPPHGHQAPLPYAFAGRAPLLLEDDGSSSRCGPAGRASHAVGGAAQVYASDRIADRGPQPGQRISTPTYAGARNPAAASVVGEVESAVDLSRMMQDLPAVEDLLEAANDAPIIRMLNACSRRRRQRRRERHPHRTLRARQLRALPRGRHAARGGATEPRPARR